jgi:hypothetical protein
MSTVSSGNLNDNYFYIDSASEALFCTQPLALHRQANIFAPSICLGSLEWNSALS